MSKTLWINSGAGISVDRFAAALIGLGVPEQGMTKIIQDAAEGFGLLDAHTHLEFLPGGIVAHRLHLENLGEMRPVSWDEASHVLDKELAGAEVKGPYAEFARRALAILRSAIHQEDLASGQKSVSLPLIGIAYTPYKEMAPYQPRVENTGDGVFYIQVDQRYTNGLQSLEAFSHIYVLSYLDRSGNPDISVKPPWRDGDEQYGIFATRAPNRPSPLGLTRARLRDIEGNRIYTGPLDLFNGTPILDIKPFIQTLDGMTEDDDPGNDGWLEGSDHLELHRLGIPHTHPGRLGILDQPQIISAVLAGIAFGLQYLGVDCSSAICASPVNYGYERSLDLPAKRILDQYEIPYQFKDYEGEYFTPAGAAILAALSPIFIAAEDVPLEEKRISYGLGGQNLGTSPTFGALSVLVIERQSKD